MRVESSLNYKKVPESLTNIIPHKYEVILAGGTGLFCSSIIGAGLFGTLALISFTVQCGELFLKVKKDEVLLSNTYIYDKEDLTNKKEQTATLKKISNVISNVITTVICYKISEFAISYFGSHCYKNDTYIQNASCSAIFGGILSSSICVCVSTGYLLKNLFK